MFGFLPISSRFPFHRTLCREEKPNPASPPPLFSPDMWRERCPHSTLLGAGRADTKSWVPIPIVCFLCWDPPHKCWPISSPTIIHLPFLISIFFPVWYEAPSFSVALFCNAFPAIQETNPHYHTTSAEAGFPPIEVNSKILVIKRQTECWWTLTMSFQHFSLPNGVY